MIIFEYISHEQLDNAYQVIKEELKSSEYIINSEQNYFEKELAIKYYEELEETFFQLSQYLGYIEFEGEFV